MNNAFLILGSNLGERKHLITLARNLIGEKTGYIKRISSVYETEPWGVTGQPNYYNQVVEILTELGAHELMATVLGIEQDMGRKRIKKYDSRIIDIDILFFNSETYDSGAVTIPHPRLHLRRFVLEPLAEIAPEFIHPISKKSLALLLSECKDDSIVKKI